MSDTGNQTLDFMPHGHCFYWQQDILFLHVGSDILIALAYFSIPFALVYLAKRRPDMGFKRFFMLFAAFILACGITHILNSWNFWHADYWLSGFAKAVTAVISMTTAVLLWKFMPVALYWPSPALLRKANEDLSQEIDLRREKEMLLQEAFDNAPIGKALVGLNGDWIKVNHALCNILGYTREEMMSMNFQQITYEADLDEDLNHSKDLIEGRSDAYQMEKRYKHKHGQLVWVLLSVTIVRDVEHSPRYFIAQIYDITYRKLTEEELRRTQAELEIRVKERTTDLEQLNRELSEKNSLLEELSTTDPLTKLYNRRVFNTKMNELMYDAQRYGYEFCIMIIDLDNFKNINDTYGHVQGDEVICAVSDILKKQLRHTDIAARFGGDEFCVLLPHTSMRRAPEIAEIFCKRIESENFETEQGEKLSVTCSIGISEFNKTINDCKDLLSKADKALYAAKQQGRNCVAICGNR